MTSIRLFKVGEVTNTLSANEKKILPHLIEAAKGIDKIFRLQENNTNNGANFYPRDAIKKEIEKAAQKDHKIFSPFTIVKRDRNNKLVAVDFHVEYKKLLAPIVNNLSQAAEICQNKSFKNYLEVLAKSLADGNYQRVDIAWLSVKGSNIDITAGPYERYLDKLFFVKRAYQASVGIIDGPSSQKAKFIRDILYTTTGQRVHRITPPTIADIQVQHNPILSGFLGRAAFSRQHLPSDPETTERHGSRILIFASTMNYKFKKIIYPIFNTVFAKSFKASYSEKLLHEGNYYYILFTAVAQQLHRYRNSTSRLRELFPILDEANSVVSGIQHAKHLVLKGAIDQKELEAVMITQICWAFSEWVLYKKSTVREDYLKGDALILNFLVKVGALQEEKGISWPNFAKMFFEMENLSTIFTRFVEEGSYVEAQEFLSKYLSLDPFKSFDEKLSHIKSI